jgi:hypothetical protein
MQLTNSHSLKQASVFNHRGIHMRVHRTLRRGHSSCNHAVERSLLRWHLVTHPTHQPNSTCSATHACSGHCSTHTTASVYAKLPYAYACQESGLLKQQHFGTLVGGADGAIVVVALRTCCHAGVRRRGELAHVHLIGAIHRSGSATTSTPSRQCRLIADFLFVSICGPIVCRAGNVALLPGHLPSICALAFISTIWMACFSHDMMARLYIELV